MKVLVFAVHPDDETLGCAGTLLKHVSNGDEVHWVVMTNYGDLPVGKERKKQRESEIYKVAEQLGIFKIHRLGLKTTRLDEYSQSELVGKLSKVMNDVKPCRLYIPFMNDVHSDHRAAFNSIYSCTKSFRYPFIKSIYMMEVLSETEYAPSIPSLSFIPNLFVDITEYIDKKIEIMHIYEGEFGEHPFPRSEKSIRAQSTLRGAMSGCDSAEAFMILKEIR